jgi:hypothetical protein
MKGFFLQSTLDFDVNESELSNIFSKQYSNFVAQANFIDEKNFLLAE